MADFVLVALPGAFLSSVGAFSDSFMLARDRVSDVFGQHNVAMLTQMRVLSSDGEPVRMSDGSLLAVHGSIDAEAQYAFVWLPAFRAGGLAQMKERLAACKPLLDWLKRQRDGGAVIGASGAASALLVAAGLAGGMTVPLADALQPLLRTLFPRQRFDERLGLADSGTILIANGLANDLTLVLRVVARLFSPEIARWLASVLGPGKEAQRMPVADTAVAQAQLWLEQHYTEQVRMEALADVMGCSPATVNRRFRAALGMSPKSYQQKLRYDSAIRMLELTSRSVDRIAELVGYSDSRLFRAMFSQRAGMAPTEWRRRTRRGDEEAEPVAQEATAP